MNVSQIVAQGLCTGCAACASCKHIHMENCAQGFPVPIIDAECTDCGRCLHACIYDPDWEDEE